MKLKSVFVALLLGLSAAGYAQQQDLVQYVNTLQGTNSKHELTRGNTYPTTALPFGMHTWTPQTGRNGNGWKYQYFKDKIRGFQQAHQCSSWTNDYAVFSLMPGIDQLQVDTQGLINLMGGNKAFTAKLDSVFSGPNTVKTGTYGGMIHEMTEMVMANMGQYAHGNQPIQHMVYLYNYANEHPICDLEWEALYKELHPPCGHCEWRNPDLRDGSEAKYRQRTA